MAEWASVDHDRRWHADDVHREDRRAEADGHEPLQGARNRESVWTPF
jgi:hypothetical protein